MLRIISHCMKQEMQLLQVNVPPPADNIFLSWIQTKAHLKHCGNNFFLKKMMYQGSFVKTNQNDQMPIGGKNINLMSRSFAEVGKQHNLHNDFTNRGYIQFQRTVWLCRPRESQILCSKPIEGNT
jgi:hypothetical protein